MTILNFKISTISFDWGWYNGDVFSWLSIKFYERCDPSWIVLFYFQVFYFQFSITVTSEAE